MKTIEAQNKSGFPLVEITLNKGDRLHIQRGSMVYRSPSVTLNAQLNANSGGFGGLLKAAARAMASNESMFVTEATSNADGGIVAIAPSAPGDVMALQCGPEQYCLNDGAFLALDGTAGYNVEAVKNIGGACFGRTGGFFIMKTHGTGMLLIEAFGTIREIQLNNESLTIDNGHVVAWSQSLDYHIHTDSGWLQSIGTGEGLVNTFTGTGKVYVQSLNIETFAGVLQPYLPTSSN